jgi:putative transcriptional regulator
MAMSRCWLAAAALVLAFASPAPARELAADAGDFLVAHKRLADPNFSETVLLVTRSEPGGTAGLVLNRPSRMPVARLFPDIPGLAALPDTIYLGGPVATGRVSFLIRVPAEPPESLFVMKGLYVSESASLLRALLGRASPMEGLRIFAGSAGWGASST